MKYVILILCALILGIQARAQGINVRKVEIRVYDIQGEKIGTGKIKAVSDTSMYFKPYYGKMIEIPYKDIGMIKTNPPSGNGILIGAATGAGLGALLGTGITSGINDISSIATPGSEDAFSTAESAIFGALLGGLPGAGLGWIVDASNKNTYHIRGDWSEWDYFKAGLQGFEPEGLSSTRTNKADAYTEAVESPTDEFGQMDRFPHRKAGPINAGPVFDATK